MSEPKALSEAAILEIRDKVRFVLDAALPSLVRDYEDRVYSPPEVWDARLDRVGSDVVNAALNVAWTDWDVSTDLKEEGK